MALAWAKVRSEQVARAAQVEGEAITMAMARVKANEGINSKATAKVVTMGRAIARTIGMAVKWPIGNSQWEI